MKPLAITLLSGGLDSAVATLLAKKRRRIELALTFDYGQRAARREIAAAKAFCRRCRIAHRVIKLPWLALISCSALNDRTIRLPKFADVSLDKDRKAREKGARAVWVPNRNAAFVNIAAAYAEAMGCDRIIAGFNTEEAATFPDNSEGFVAAANRLFLTSTLSHPKLESPTQKMTKPEIARAAIRMKIARQFFWSCYNGGAKMCGHCESCARVIRSFKIAGAWDMIKNRFCHCEES